MAGHLGTVARLVPVVPTSAQRVQAPDRYAFQDTRARRWAFATGARPRAWEVDCGLLSQTEVGMLREFLDGAWGHGPFVWVPCTAHAGNLLTPTQSLLTGLATSGADGVAGWSPRAVLGPASVTLAAGVPVLPGEPVTAGVEASGAATMTLTWRNATGGVVGTVTQSGTGTLMQRIVRTVTAPATARTVDLSVSGHVAATRPQVAWATALPEYVPGQASKSVVIQNGVTDPLVVAPGMSWWSGSVQIVEVG